MVSWNGVMEWCHGIVERNESINCEEELSLLFVTRQIVYSGVVEQ